MELYMRGSQEGGGGGYIWLEWINRWIDGSMNEWMDIWMDGWVDG